MGGGAVTFPILSPARRDPRLALVDALSVKLARQNARHDLFDRYYTGDQSLSFMAADIAAIVGDGLAPLVINWSETIVDSVNRRLHVEGFRLGQGGEADDELWRIFTANDMDEESPLGHADALVHGVTYLAVWGNDDDPLTPLITFESAHQVAVEYDPTGRGVRSALKRWRDGDTEFATLYLPDRVIRYAASAGDSNGPRWEIDQQLDNPLGVVPIVPMVNRGRLLNRDGRSELASVAPLVDAIAEMATGMLATARYYVTPRRFVTGMQVGDAANRDRLQSEMEKFWERAHKSKMLVGGEGVSFGQFNEASLDGFVQGINLLTSSLAAIGGLPPDDLGLNTANPASAEARRAAETVLILRATEKQRALGGAYARAMRLAVAARDGLPLAAIPQEFSRLQVAWADPATPAIAQAMDAAVKGKQEGIYDVEAAQEAVGMSPVERAAMKARAAEAAAQAATADIRARLDLARELAGGVDIALSPNAALAASGLTIAATANSADAAQ